MLRITVALTLLLLAGSPCARASSLLDFLCDWRGIANHLMDAELKKALALSIKCEDKNLAHDKENTFADQNLKGAYLASAQILTAQGKLDLARARLEMARALPDNFLIDLQTLLDTTEGYLLERSGQADEVVKFYRQSSRDAQVRLGAYYRDRGRNEEALQIITDFLQYAPAHPAAHAILGDILAPSNKAAALAEYERALSLATQGAPSVVPVTYLEVGRAKRGIALLQK